MRRRQSHSGLSRLAQIDQRTRQHAEQARRLADILALGNELKSLDRDVVVRSTVEAVHQRLGFGLVTLSLVEEDDPTRVRAVAWSGLEGSSWERLTATTFPLIDFGAMTDAIQVGSCYLLCAPGSPGDISSDANPVPWTESDQLYVPLTSSDELLGYLTVDRPDDGLRPTRSTVEVLEIFANQAAIAIQNANLYAQIDRALDERVAELAMLQEIDNQLNQSLDFDHVMNMTLDWAMRITGAAAGTLVLRAGGSEALQVVAHRGYPPLVDGHWTTPWPYDEGIVGQVMRTGEHACVSDVASQGIVRGAEIGTRSHVSVPIRGKDRVVGAINLESAARDGFTVEHLASLARLADHAVIAIENARLYAQTSRQVAELSALQQISLDLTSSLDLTAVLDSVASSTYALTHADCVNIYLYDAHEDRLAFNTCLSAQGKETAPPIPVEEDGLTRQVARSGESVTIRDASTEHPELLRWGVGAVASMPLRKAAEVRGVFNVVYSAAHAFSGDELVALGLIADHAAIAVHNAQLYRQVQRANEAKSEFVSTVSHELKIPMTSIQGYARLIALGAGGPVTAEQRTFADVILRNARRMSVLVSDLLDLSRIDAGRVRIQPRPIALDRVVAEAASAVEGEFAAKGHRLEVVLPPGLPKVRVDPGRIAQVWVNLLSNACKYTAPEGQIRVWAKAQGSTVTGDGGWVLCAVEDTGVGIAAQDQERLFEPFYRVRSAETHAEPGTGLGLSICAGIVELHGGRIWLDSTPGKGSTFYFTLPVA